MTTRTAHAAAPVATALAEALTPLLRGPLPVRLECWDGSTAGPDDAPVVRLTSPAALRRQLCAPGELGAAQAYVTGELDVPGDLRAGLDHVWSVVRERDLVSRRPGPSTLTALTRFAVTHGLLGPRPTVPETQIAVRGRRHSRRRDREVIRRHYDLPTDFYALVLDESMAYSCGWFPEGRPAADADPDTVLAAAQQAKFDLVCSELELSAGDHLLDIGCGWGSLAVHAAERTGARVTAVTISREQHEFARRRVAERGLDGLVDVRLQDYRDVTAIRADAVVSLEMGEHVGDREYPGFVRVLERSVVPGGRVLVQQMSRGGRHPGGGPFIESFIAPDMSMRSPGQTLDLLTRGALEVRSVRGMREHYACTAEQWRRRFTRNRAEVAARWGEELARVWDLYLTGGTRSFAEGRMGVEQFVLRRADGRPAC
ncbi:MAG TPA: cyclopropane-fatty-acyl-phospholipid synthase family protein [Candidatus Dietzia intestinigallinarum]|nr:cyclopropane-fatty-acyl-phospholipid synthase family protein [Candidatus Dietzia intestinigallinarum]